MPAQSVSGFSTSAQPTDPPYVNIQDQKASGTDGGTFNNGAWQTRTLNTVVSDLYGLALLSSNQITLPPGTYRVRSSAVAAACDRHQARLQNITDATTTILGINTLALLAGPDETSAILTGQFTITTQKTFELQHRCQTTRLTTGFGFSGSWGTEVYAIIEFWKIA